MAVREMEPVLVRRKDAAYPRAPFHPPRLFPEASRLGLTETDPGNAVYEMVRRSFELLDLDRAHRGTRDWNPLADVVARGSRVVIKPNFVQHYDHEGSFVQLVTHPSVLRPILDYLLLAQGTLENVAILDAPEIDCRLDETLRRLGFGEMTAFYESLGQRVEVIDIRTERAEYHGGAAIVDRIALPGDPRGFVTLDLGTRSEIVPIVGRAPFYGADYDRRHTNEHHTRTRNVYVVSRTFLEADLIVSVPKLKTHKKAGLTAAMKNLVGVNGDKNLLPHYTIGDALAGGCEYSSASSSSMQEMLRRADRWYRDRILARRSPLGGKLYNRLAQLREEVLPLCDPGGRSKGDWWGNDVVWRMILDLNKLLHYATPAGTITDRPQRRQLAIVDAIVAGEGDGPHLATPRALGAIVAGFDPVAVDAVGARLLGLDPLLVPQIAGAAAIGALPIGGGDLAHFVIDEDGAEPLRVASLPPAMAVPPARPPGGWIGHIEAVPRIGEP